MKNCTMKTKEMKAGDGAVAGLHSEGGGGDGGGGERNSRGAENGVVGRSVHNNTIIKFPVGFCTS